MENEDLTEENIEQHLSRIVKGQTFSQQIFETFRHLKKLLFLVDIRSKSLDLVTFVEDLG